MYLNVIMIESAISTTDRKKLFMYIALIIITFLRKNIFEYLKAATVLVDKHSFHVFLYK